MRYGDQGPATLSPAPLLPTQTLPSTHSLVEHCTPSCSGLGDASDPEGRAGFGGSRADLELERGKEKADGCREEGGSG